MLGKIVSTALVAFASLAICSASPSLFPLFSDFSSSSSWSLAHYDFALDPHNQIAYAMTYNALNESYCLISSDAQHSQAFIHYCDFNNPIQLQNPFSLGNSQLFFQVIEEVGEGQTTTSGGFYIQHPEIFINQEQTPISLNISLKPIEHDSFPVWITFSNSPLAFLQSENGEILYFSTSQITTGVEKNAISFTSILSLNASLEENLHSIHYLSQGNSPDNENYLLLIDSIELSSGNEILLPFFLECSDKDCQQWKLFPIVMDSPLSSSALLNYDYYQVNSQGNEEFSMILCSSEQSVDCLSFNSLTKSFQLFSSSPCSSNGISSSSSNSSGISWIEFPSPSLNSPYAFVYCRNSSWSITNRNEFSTYTKLPRMDSIIPTGGNSIGRPILGRNHQLYYFSTSPMGYTGIMMNITAFLDNGKLSYQTLSLPQVASNNGQEYSLDVGFLMNSGIFIDYSPVQQGYFIPDGSLTGVPLFTNVTSHGLDISMAFWPFPADSSSTPSVWLANLIDLGNGEVLQSWMIKDN